MPGPDHTPYLPIDQRTHDFMRFYPGVRVEPWRFGPYCAACGAKMPVYEGPWVYSMTSLDDTLCETCGNLFAPAVMSELRKYYAWEKAQQAKSGRAGPPEMSRPLRWYAY